MVERLVFPSFLCCSCYQINSRVCSAACPYHQQTVATQCPTLATLLASNHSLPPAEAMLNSPCYPLYSMTNCLFTPAELCPCWNMGRLQRMNTPVQPQHRTHHLRQQQHNQIDNTFVMPRAPRLLGREQFPVDGSLRRRAFGRSTSDSLQNISRQQRNTASPIELLFPMVMPPVNRSNEMGTSSETINFQLSEDIFMLPETDTNLHSFSSENYDSLLGLARQLAHAKPKGLTRVEINQMQAYLFRPDLKKPSKGQTNCVICMCDFECRQKVRIMPCKHHFHSRCIDKWLKTNRTCPICRYECKLMSGKKSSKHS